MYSTIGCTMRDAPNADFDCSYKSITDNSCDIVSCRSDATYSMQSRTVSHNEDCMYASRRMSDRDYYLSPVYIQTNYTPILPVTDSIIDSFDTTNSNASIALPENSCPDSSPQDPYMVATK